jgi:hypothetical protein
MRIDHERSGSGNRWSVQTSGAIDRALAALLLACGLTVAHVLGLPAALWALLRTPLDVTAASVSNRPRDSVGSASQAALGASGSLPAPQRRVYVVPKPTGDLGPDHRPRRPHPLLMPASN